MDRRAVRGGAGEHAPPPRAEVRHSKDELTFAIEVPGLHPEDLELEIDHGVLSVRGQRGRRHIARSWRLPENVDRDRVIARLDDGVLTIVIPKVSPRRIEIHVGKPTFWQRARRWLALGGGVAAGVRSDGADGEVRVARRVHLRGHRRDTSEACVHGG